MTRNFSRTPSPPKERVLFDANVGERSDSTIHRGQDDHLLALEDLRKTPVLFALKSSVRHRHREAASSNKEGDACDMVLEMLEKALAIVGDRDEDLLLPTITTQTGRGMEGSPKDNDDGDAQGEFRWCRQ